VLAFDPSVEAPHCSEPTSTVAVKEIPKLCAAVPPKAAVSVAVCGELMVAVLTVKVAVVPADATVADAGAVSTFAIAPPIVTDAPPVGAGWFNVTVHVVLVFDPRLDVPQLSDDTSTGATSEMPKVLDDPFSEALSVAV
jgi:hypothetical protein